MAPVTMVCTECGSEDIKIDAWAFWNKLDQEWKLSDYFTSKAICESCDGPCSIEEVELD